MSGLKRWVGVLAAALGLLALTPVAAQAKWLKAETPHFVLYSDGSEGNLRALAGDLEEFDALLRASHGLDPAGAPARKLDL